MILARRRAFRLDAERIALRLPLHSDFSAWRTLRDDSRAFLTPWEPVWSPDHLSRKSFTNRVYWAARFCRAGRLSPVPGPSRRHALLGAIALDNIRRGPAQSGTIGCWIGQEHARAWL